MELGILELGGSGAGVPFGNLAHGGGAEQRVRMDAEDIATISVGGAAEGRENLFPHGGLEAVGQERGAGGRNGFQQIVRSAGLGDVPLDGHESGKGAVFIEQGLAFDVDNINSLEAVYSIEHWPESALRNLLQTFFSWEVALLLELWGIPFREEQVNTLHGALLELVNKTNADLFAWVAAYATAQQRAGSTGAGLQRCAFLMGG